MSAFLFSTGVHWPARAAACAPARFAEPAGELPAAWRAAMKALSAATAVEGQPWSCNGSLLALHLKVDGSAELEVEDAQGRSARRLVPSPDDLVPMGEALLAAPLPAPQTPPPGAPAPESTPSARTSAVAPPVPPAPPSAAAPAPPPPHGPRLQVDALASSRFAGPTRGFWFGGVLRATLPFEAWSGGVWARFDAPAVTLDPWHEAFSMTEVSVGLALDRRVFAEPFELRIGFEPSLAVVSMVGGAEPDLHDGAKADPRLGLAVRAVWPVSRAWRLLAGVDGEVAPGAAGSLKSRQIDPELPSIPAFTVGVTFGAGVGLP
jgi:hypothetical protein